MKLTRAEAAYLGLDDEQRPWVADDSKEAGEIRALRAKSGQPGPVDNRPAFSFQPARTSAHSVVLPAPVWAQDDRLIEDTRQAS
jgi:hypothetical protein